MTSERPLGIVSDELDRVLARIDQRFDEAAVETNRRFDEQGDRLEVLSDTIRDHNGRLRLVERAQEFARGVAAGAGGSWHVLVGALGAAVGLGGLVLAIVMATR